MKVSTKMKAYTIKGWIAKVVLLINMGCTILFMLLPWMRVEGIKEVNGLVILSGNVVLSVIILCLYIISVLFYEKNKVFPITGIASVCMVFSIMFSRFEQWGRFSTTLPGPYLGLISVLINLVLLIVLCCKNIRKIDHV